MFKRTNLLDEIGKKISIKIFRVKKGKDCFCLKLTLFFRESMGQLYFLEPSD